MSDDLPVQEGCDAPALYTYGDLRRWLAENGDPWSIDQLISDDEPLPEFPLGGLPDDMGEQFAMARLDSDIDVRKLITDLPPNDPGLRQRWEEAGVPLDRIPEAVTGDRGEEQEPTRDENDGLGEAS